MLEGSVKKIKSKRLPNIDGNIQFKSNRFKRFSKRIYLFIHMKYYQNKSNIAVTTNFYNEK